MKKNHSLFQLIKSLESSEKAYFKKYGFKKSGKNNDSFKRIFDIVDKQKSFDIDKILLDKRIESKIKERLHVNLNHLYNRIIQSTLDYRKEQSELAQIFDAILEFYFLVDKKLLSLAEKKMKSIYKMTLNNDWFMFKPFISFLPFKIIRIELSKTTHKREKHLEILADTIEDFNVLAKTQIIGLELEGMMIRNSGPLLKYQDDKDLAFQLIDKTKKLIALNKQDFQLRSVLTNDLFVLLIMVGKMKDIDELSHSLLDFYYENMAKKTVATQLFDFLVILINLSNVMLFSNNIDMFNKCIEILNSEINNIADSFIEDALTFQMDILVLIDNKSLGKLNLEYHKQHIERVENQELLLFKYVKAYTWVLLKLKRYDEVLDLSDEAVNSKSKDGSAKTIAFIKAIRAIAWLKKENLNLFSSEIEAAYKIVSKKNEPKFVLKCINYIKKLPQKDSTEIKKNKISKLREELETLKNNYPISMYFFSFSFFKLIESESEL